MFLALAVFLAIEIIGGPLANSPPDVKNFKQVLSKELEFRTDDYKAGFVGRIIDYQNPNDPNEFIRVYYRQVAIVSERAQENNSTEAGGFDGNSSNLNYHRKQETETLVRVQQATDAFAYVQEWVVYDPQTGQNIRTGQRKIWLLDPSGVWAYFVQPSNEKSALESSPVSEPSKADPKKRINVGIRFTLADAVHIVRIDQDEILALIEKKEAVNE